MVSDSQKAASRKWRKENLKRVPLDLREPEYNDLKSHCAKVGKPVNAYIRELIRSDISRTDPVISDILTEQEYNQLQDILNRESADFTTILRNAILRYIDKHKQ